MHQAREPKVRPMQQETRHLGQIAVGRARRSSQLETLFESLATPFELDHQPDIDLGLYLSAHGRLELCNVMHRAKDPRGGGCTPRFAKATWRDKNFEQMPQRATDGQRLASKRLFDARFDSRVVVRHDLLNLTKISGGNKERHQR